MYSGQTNERDDSRRQQNLEEKNIQPKFKEFLADCFIFMFISTVMYQISFTLALSQQALELDGKAVMADSFVNVPYSGRQWALHFSCL